MFKNEQPKRKRKAIPTDRKGVLDMPRYLMNPDEETEKLTIRFFQLRFPRRTIEHEKASLYFYEWCSRIYYGKFYTMDSDSIKAYNRAKNELKLDVLDKRIKEFQR